MSWFKSTNHKQIGILYLLFSIFAGLVGTGLSVAMRMELARPDFGIFAGNGQAYNVTITAHGYVMIFFFIMPLLIGFFGN